MYDFDITGGPAYPQNQDWQNDMDAHERKPDRFGAPTTCGIGMTLLDYFAGQAMQGLLAQSIGTGYHSPKDHAAEFAYSMAAEMLRARAKILEATHD
jgi:hypothetical protein